jgi:chemotaxis protein histidine kinase CheA
MEDSALLEEFVIESQELLDNSEDALMSLETKGSDFEESYKVVFRSFHSLKGGSGMMGLDSLQSHLHLMEDSFERFHDDHDNLVANLDYFLQGIDVARALLLNEEPPIQKMLNDIKPKEKTRSGKVIEPVKKEKQEMKEEALVDLLNRSVSLLLYQFSDLDEYLETQGRETVRQTLREEIKNILEKKESILSEKE